MSCVMIRLQVWFIVICLILIFSKGFFYNFFLFLFIWLPTLTCSRPIHLHYGRTQMKAGTQVQVNIYSYSQAKFAFIFMHPSCCSELLNQANLWVYNLHCRIKGTGQFFSSGKLKISNYSIQLSSAELRGHVSFCLKEEA